MKTKQELKKYFENGDIPVQEDFWALMDSYWHKDEKLNNTSLDLPVYTEFAYSPTDSTEIIGTDNIIVFPEGIKTVGGFIFSVSVPRISKIIFPKSLERIKARAFNSQYLKGTITIPGSCKTIETFAFASGNARISKIILEEGVETIESSAFQLSTSSDLTALYIPDSVSSVGENAFAIPSLQTVSAPQGLDLSRSGIPIGIITYR
ncbi:leucine-rich repeat domain-containing protein [Chryseobacterium sp. X308]|uniref:leucine-rich repeat domain-containing protein n=1 Tax=Chryseobacterium sp. X308 TaxID=2884873 RepID=UPI001D15092F|nr:leucine-rich repeat domain-containing protein [Chryseobacterium sp. X308]MCC3213974.1 leucine-rich repeat domain-containing protein [Chryseobacterium sp. X308]